MGADLFRDIFSEMTYKFKPVDFEHVSFLLGEKTLKFHTNLWA